MTAIRSALGVGAALELFNERGSAAVTTNHVAARAGISPGPLDDETVADLVHALWIIAETWLAFGELDGSYADAEDGTRLLGVVLRPYLADDHGSVDGRLEEEPRTVTEGVNMLWHGNQAGEPCLMAQKSVTRAASSVGHSSEGRARVPVRTAERASFIAVVAWAHSEGLHSPRSSVAIIRVGELTRAAAQAMSVLLRMPDWTVRAMAPRLARDMGATSASTASGSVRRVRSVSIPSSSPWRTGPRIPMAR